jgi:DNA primase
VGWAPDAWDRVLTGSRRAGFGARAMRADQKPKYLNTSDGEVFHKGRIVYGADLARAAAAKAGRVVLVEGYTDVIALHQAGVPEVVAQMGTALTEPQIDAIARLAPRALFCQDPDSAGQAAVARGIAALRAHNSARSTRAVEFRIVRLPSGADPADVVQGSGAEAMRALLDEAVPIERFEVERALEQGDASTDEMLAAAAEAIAPLPASVLRDELVRLVADRLGLGEQLVNEAMRSPGAGRRGAGTGAAGSGDGHGGGAGGEWGGNGDGGPGWAGARGQRGWGEHGGRPWNGRRDGARRGGGRDRFREHSAPPEPVDPRAALARREQSERAFLAYCIALPDHGERRLADVDIEDYFSSPTSRQAAAYLRNHLRHPGGNLPSGDEPLARLVAELTVDAHRLEATPGKLELEALQLDLHRLERHISNARVSGGGGISALAVERQKVLDQIRHRLM